MLGQVTPIPIIQVSVNAEGCIELLSPPDGDQRLCALYKFRVKKVDSREIHRNRLVLQPVTLSFGCLGQTGGLLQTEGQRKSLGYALQVDL